MSITRPMFMRKMTSRSISCRKHRTICKSSSTPSDEELLDKVESTVSKPSPIAEPYGNKILLFNICSPQEKFQSAANLTTS